MNYSPSIPRQTMPSIPDRTIFSNQHIIIIALSALLLFSFLGINILSILGNMVENIIFTIKPLFISILSFFGYTTGTILSTTSTIVGETTKKAIDVTEDVLTGTGDALVNLSKTGELSNTIQNKKWSISDPSPAMYSNPVLKPKNGQGWCLVGEYQDQRGCVEVNQSDKCMSGQIFPTKEQCLRPIN